MIRYDRRKFGIAGILLMLIFIVMAYNGYQGFGTFWPAVLKAKIETDKVAWMQSLSLGFVWVSALDSRVHGIFLALIFALSIDVVGVETTDIWIARLSRRALLTRDTKRAMLLVLLNSVMMMVLLVVETALWYPIAFDNLGNFLINLVIVGAGFTVFYLFVAILAQTCRYLFMSRGLGFVACAFFLVGDFYLPTVFHINEMWSATNILDTLYLYTLNLRPQNGFVPSLSQLADPAANAGFLLIVIVALVIARREIVLHRDMVFTEERK
ncbi:hypothetical protein [Lacticaseibacillus mingshuiensis]|uniref:ABC transporter permease n=1 Tax=Lacticaseibacillus mingshuiensis TaxID=2799574 RepID=A0ABW4CI87_9LACO|nr:hypothetical protein [Lacticaseibacillus mingshuiensis]